MMESEMLEPGGGGGWWWNEESWNGGLVVECDRYRKWNWWLVVLSAPHCYKYS